MNILKVLLAILLPPVGVFMAYGVGPTLVINILLTLLGWVPGSIHALWAVLKREEVLKAEEAARQSYTNPT